MKYYEEQTDIVVVGAGHAGCEAALIAAKMDLKVTLITLSIDQIAYLACNPSIGGTGKGQLVVELDALGGYMGINTDKTLIQSKMLNTSKGKAVRSLRAQVDKKSYQNEMKKHIEEQKNIKIVMDEVVDLIKKDNKITGVITKIGAKYHSKAVILCTGVYLDSRVYIGEVNFSSGPLGHNGAYGLSENLEKIGIKLRKFKTGTPARVHKDTIDFSQMTEHQGDEKITPFSFITKEKPENKVSCYLTRTNEKTHKIIQENASNSSFYRGDMKAISGARYCPSIEDKVIRFKDKESHQFFVEPEGLETKEYYIQGFSSSLPYETQIQMYHTVKGLENAQLTRPAYAIEYDCIDPLILDNTLKVIELEGLYMAGQINSTSGYEEAAAQGLLAGINAAAKIKGLEPLILDRSNSYIGVLIDDITTKGTNEPYRMMTSRAEYRLMIRQDNADYRLTPLAEKYGTIDENRKQIFKKKYDDLEKELERIKIEKIAPQEINSYLQEVGEEQIKEKTCVKEILKRPKVDYSILEKAGYTTDIDDNIKEKAEIEVKYEGYIVKNKKQIENFKKLEKKTLSTAIDYSKIDGLRLEAREKLSKIKPTSIGQASRISGVSPADISVLLIYLKMMGKE